MVNAKRFEDAVVVITGSGSGIGAVAAARFAEEGARVAIVDIDEGAAAETAAGIPNASAHVVDITQRDPVRALVAEFEADLGGVDVLVNNAAVCADTPFTELPEEEWHRDVAVSLTGSFLASQAVLPAMTARGSGVILNIASVNGLSYFGNEAYSAAKAGLLSLTRSIAVRYGPLGVRCNAIAPGTIATPLWNDRLENDPTVLDRARRWYPLRRVGTPDDVASAMLFLASDDASWVTGITLTVDGGLLAGNLMMSDDIMLPDDEQELVG